MRELPQKLQAVLCHLNLHDWDCSHCQKYWCWACCRWVSWDEGSDDLTDLCGDCLAKARGYES